MGNTCVNNKDGWMECRTESWMKDGMQSNAMSEVERNKRKDRDRLV